MVIELAAGCSGSAKSQRALFMDRNNRSPGRQLRPPTFPLTASDKPGSWLVKNPSIDKAPARWYPKRPSAHLARDSAPLSHTNGGPRSSPPSIPSFPHPPPISSGNLGCISTLPRVSQMAPEHPQAKSHTLAPDAIVGQCAATRQSHQAPFQRTVTVPSLPLKVPFPLPHFHAPSRVSHLQSANVRSASQSLDGPSCGCRFRTLFLYVLWLMH